MKQQLVECEGRNADLSTEVQRADTDASEKLQVRFAGLAELLFCQVCLPVHANANADAGLARKAVDQAAV